jgi:hypothetical protein
MPTARPFSYNTGAGITGTTQVGSLAVGTPTDGFTLNPRFWNGPDEELGYVIAHPVPSGTQPNPVPGATASLGFNRTKDFTSASFISLAEYVSRKYANNPQTFASATAASTWLTSNGFWNSYTSVVPTNLQLYLDAGIPSSYSGTGNVWYDLSGNGNDVTMQNSGSISWTGGSISYFSTGSNGWFSRTNASNVPIGNSEYTLSAWVQLGSTWNSNGMVSIGTFGVGNQSNALRAGSTNQILNYWWANDLSVTSSVSPATSWFNVVAKFDGTTRSIWVNGASVGSDTPGSGHNVTSSNVQVAKTTGNEYLQGNIGQVLMYDRALSSTEILGNFDNTKSNYGY